MKRLWHHIKKDLNHLKYPFLFWFILVVVEQLPLDQMLGLESSTAAGISRFLSFFEFAVLFIMVPLLIQADQPVGNTAFWVTRPISWKGLLTAKLFFIFIFISGITVLLEILSMIFRQVTCGDILAAVPEIFIETLVPVIPLVILALVTPNLKRYLVFGIAAIFVFVIGRRVLIGFLIVMFPMIRETVINLSKFIYNDSNALVFELLVILLGGAVIIHQYLTRKTLRSILLTAAAFVFTLLAAIIWPWDFFEIETAVNRLQPNDQRVQDLTVGSRLQIFRGQSFSRSGPEAGFGFSYAAKYSGIPEGYLLRLDSLDNVKIILPGKPITSTSSISGRGYVSDQSKYRALQQVFTPSSIVTEDFFPILARPRLRFSINGFSKPLARRCANLKGTFSADAQFHLYRYNIVGRLPLKVGRQCKKGSEFIRVDSVTPEGDACTVRVKFQYTHFKFKPKRKDLQTRHRNFFIWENIKIVLHNKKRREILVTSDWERGRFAHSRWKMVKPDNRVNVLTEDFRFKALGFVGRREDTYLLRIDDSWIADAELVCLEQENIGGFIKPVRFENFRIPYRNNTVFADFTGGITKVLKDPQTGVQPLEKIKLPENADKKQVKEYIRQILSASNDQSRLSSDDIRVGMLAQVGPEHIDALAEVGDLLNNLNSKSYVTRAIMRIARPEDKEVILSILGDYPGLIQVVVREGWLRDARDVILKEFEAVDNSISREWFKAAVSLKDKSLYPLLKQFFLESGHSDKTRMYKMLRYLPGIDLSDTIPRYWRASKYSNVENLSRVVPIALEWGLVDALEVAFDLMEDRRLSKSQRDRLWKTINKYIEYKGDKPDIIRWFRRNKDHFIFDKQEKKFLIR